MTELPESAGTPGSRIPDPVPPAAPDESPPVAEPAFASGTAAATGLAGEAGAAAATGMAGGAGTATETGAADTTDLAGNGDLAPPEDSPFAGEPAPPAARPRPRRGAILVAAGIVLALVAGGAVTFGGLAAAGRLRADPTPTVAPTPVPTATPVARLVDGNAVGSPDAPVTVEVWADYQCPYCRLESIAYGPSIEREYVLPGRARIVYRDFAFLGQESIDAAIAARCAGQQAPGAYWRYHDILFAAQQGENQGTFGTENLVTLAKIVGLDQTAFRTCLGDAAVAAAVTGSTAEGRNLGIESTPTTRVTGPGGTRVLKGFSPDWKTVAAAIDAVAQPAPSPDASASPGASGSAGPAPSDGPGSTVPPSATPSPSPAGTPGGSPAGTPAPAP